MWLRMPRIKQSLVQSVFAVGKRQIEKEVCYVGKVSQAAEKLGFAVAKPAKIWQSSAASEKASAMIAIGEHHTTMPKVF